MTKYHYTRQRPLRTMGAPVYVTDHRTVEVGPPTFEVRVPNGTVTAEGLDAYMAALGWTRAPTTPD